MNFLQNLTARLNNHPTNDELLKNFPLDIRSLPLKEWDKGLFDAEMVALDIQPSHFHIKDGQASGDLNVSKGQINEGTYEGTQAALTELYGRVERRSVAWFPAL